MNDEAIDALASALCDLEILDVRTRARYTLAALNAAGWILKKPEYVNFELNHTPPVAHRPQHIGAPIVATVHIKRRPWYRRIF